MDLLQCIIYGVIGSFVGVALYKSCSKLESLSKNGFQSNIIIKSNDIDGRILDLKQKKSAIDKLESQNSALMQEMNKKVLKQYNQIFDDIISLKKQAKELDINTDFLKLNGGVMNDFKENVNIIFNIYSNDKMIIQFEFIDHKNEESYLMQKVMMERKSSISIIIDIEKQMEYEKKVVKENLEYVLNNWNMIYDNLNNDLVNQCEEQLIRKGSNEVVKTVELSNSLQGNHLYIDENQYFENKKQGESDNEKEISLIDLIIVLFILIVDLIFIYWALNFLFSR